MKAPVRSRTALHTLLPASSRQANSQAEQLLQLPGQVLSLAILSTWSGHRAGCAVICAIIPCWRRFAAATALEEVLLQGRFRSLFFQTCFSSKDTGQLLSTGSR